MDTAKLDITHPDRIVHCEDALAWLEKCQLDPSHSLISSIPDLSEFPTFSLEQWQEWFTKAAHLILSRTPDLGVTVFYQSDIKFEGTWIDKAYLCQKAGEMLGHKLLWHKIICRSLPGAVTYGRPGYSHILCFSKQLKAAVEHSTSDVIPEIGEKTWPRGMGINGCIMIAKFILEQTSTDTIVNPFCGQGSMLAVANSLGLKAIGIERSPKRAEKARTLRYDLETKSWL